MASLLDRTPRTKPEWETLAREVQGARAFLAAAQAPFLTPYVMDQRGLKDHPRDLLGLVAGFLGVLPTSPLFGVRMRLDVDSKVEALLRLDTLTAEIAVEARR